MESLLLYTVYYSEIKTWISTLHMRKHTDKENENLKLPKWPAKYNMGISDLSPPDLPLLVRIWDEGVKPKYDENKLVRASNLQNEG